MSITWPTYYEVPPIQGIDDPSCPAADKGKSTRTPRIFIQDFMTSVTFRIGANSLHNAYYSIPDMRSTQMSLGLSVDLKWQQGFTYDITL